ncbi:lysophospholipid acyltransferase family protein [bacterium]|nr:lysophospholipid acyltransferase family protein [bacterium]
MKIRMHPGIISFLGSFLIRLLGFTWRVEWKGMENLEKARGLSENVIFSLWHGRLLALIYTHRGRNIQVLTSEHYDGYLIGKTIKRLKYGHLKGSSTRGGAKALRQLMAVLKKGFDVGLTIDGPIGPRGMVQQGAVELSRMTGCVIVPLSCAARRRYLFSSWDRFQLPLPFSRVIVSYGIPIEIQPGADADSRKKAGEVLQKRLNDITSDMDISMGYHGSDVWPHEDL